MKHNVIIGPGACKVSIALCYKILIALGVRSLWVFFFLIFLRSIHRCLEEMSLWILIRSSINKEIISDVPDELIKDNKNWSLGSLMPVLSRIILKKLQYSQELVFVKLKLLSKCQYLA